MKYTMQDFARLAGEKNGLAQSISELEAELKAKRMTLEVVDKELGRCKNELDLE